MNVVGQNVFSIVGLKLKYRVSFKKLYINYIFYDFLAKKNTNACLTLQQKS